MRNAWMFFEWIRACRDLGIRQSPLYYFKLRSQYAERQRFYHTWDHIVNCIKILNGNFRYDPDLPAVKMAIFFHDAVYNPKRKDNEDRSCEQFTEFACERVNLEDTKCRYMISKVANLIEITKSHKVESPFATRAQQIMIDVDMAILGAPLLDYLNYVVNVWREYSSFGREAYVAGRLAFLRSLDPNDIFTTPELRILHPRSETNIALEIESLETAPEKILV